MNAVQWTSAQVGDWASTVGLEQHKKAIAKKLDGIALFLATSADLQAIGIDV